MRLKCLPVLIGYSTLLISSAAAWSQLSCSLWSPSSCDRKTFFRDGASFAAGTAMLAGGSLITSPTPAVAVSALSKSSTSSKIYEVVPGSLQDRVIVITGASTGLGLESAKRLAVGGATLVLTTRSPEKNQKALQQVRDYLQERQVENPNLYALTLDLDDLENSVKTFPNRYKKLLGGNSFRPIDVLMNNAGVAAIPTREITKDGFERTFQSNHLGPFVLTALLFPLLRRDKDTRVINVSSYAHSFATIHDSTKTGLDLENLNGEVWYEPWPSYSRSKLENILFSRELQQRADAAGVGDWLTVVSLHPGVVGTDIWRNTAAIAKQQQDSKSNNPLQRLTSSLFYAGTLTTEQGANTQVWLASAPAQEISKGQYYDENRRIKALEPFAQDADKAQQLWEATEQMSGVKFVVE